MNVTKNKTMKKCTGVKSMAFRDISQWIIDEKLIVRDGLDVLILSPYRIDTKQSLRFNRLLGITNINKCKKK